MSLLTIHFHKSDSKEIVEHPDIDGILEGLRKGDLHKVADSMGNVLEDVTIPMHPVIADIKQVMQDCGAIGAMMSGSGPTVFGLFENRASAREAQKMIRDKGLTRQAYVTNIHNVTACSSLTEAGMLTASQCQNPLPVGASRSWMVTAKLFVPSGGLVQKSSGD